MDLVFEQFLEQHYAQLPAKQKELFSRIIEESDLDIMDWILGRQQPSLTEYNVLIKQFRELKRE
jgi:succinate dehydrogenase flavin-adding protein (antitoxin of CptAB toxin-antitoxin module)